MSTDLKLRTKKFTISIIEIIDKLPSKTSTKVIGYQLAKSGTSVGANYRAACRARSDKEFVSKLNIVLEETDETAFWLEIIQEMNWLESELVNKLWKEADELTAIFVTILKNTKARMKDEDNL